jgi:hypothetical protein
VVGNDQLGAHGGGHDERTLLPGNPPERPGHPPS